MWTEAGEVLEQVRALELAARRNVSSQLAGAYRSAVVGRGLEFHEARKYVQGESVRQIDWKMTARLDEPWVRRFKEEREREIFLAVDISPSMFAGWQQRSKMETAVELAATLAVSAVEAHDRLGLVSFAENVQDVLSPQLGRAQLYRVLDVLLKRLYEGPKPCRVSDPRAAIHAIESRRGRRFVIFLISDFIDADVPEDLHYLRHRHDVSLFHVYDPLEYAVSSDIRLPACSPEGETRRRWLRLGDTGGLSSVQRFLGSEAGRLGFALRSVSSAESLGPLLAEFFHQKQRRTRR